MVTLQLLFDRCLSFSYYPFKAIPPPWFQLCSCHHPQVSHSSSLRHYSTRTCSPPPHCFHHLHPSSALPPLSPPYWSHTTASPSAPPRSRSPSSFSSLWLYVSAPPSPCLRQSLSCRYHSWNFMIGWFLSSYSVFRPAPRVPWSLSARSWAGRPHRGCFYAIAERARPESKGSDRNWWETAVSSRRGPSSRSSWKRSHYN